MVPIRSVCRPAFIIRRTPSPPIGRIVPHILYFIPHTGKPMRILLSLISLLFVPSAVFAATACVADTVSPDLLPSESRSLPEMPVVSEFNAAPRPAGSRQDSGFPQPVSYTSAGGPDSVAAVISSRLSELICNDIFARTQFGLYVYDLTTDRPVFACGERQQLRPASNQKVVTAIAALKLLGTDFRYATSLYADGNVCDSVLQGNLCIRAGFDPLFDSADLQTFISALGERGIRAVSGDLIFDRTIKDTASLGWGWCWDDKEIPLSPLLYNGRPGLEHRFAAALSEQGISLGGAIRYGTLPSSAEHLCTCTHTIDQVLLPMMKRSDNLYAESLFYQIAARNGQRHAGRKQAAAQINGLISGLGLDPKAYQIADGSGLSLYNYLSPELLVSLLRHAYRHSSIYNHLLPSLPVAGIDGTLRRRMKSGPACGNVCAKTGTVEGVSTLSGYCTAPDGHTYCFSIMNQGIRHTSTGRNFQDRVCQALTRPLDVPSDTTEQDEETTETTEEAAPTAEENTQMP